MATHIWLIDFATEVIAERRRSGRRWDEAVEIIRMEHGIDEFGMPEIHLEILKALTRSGPMSKHGLRAVAECEVEELDEYVLPVMRREGLIHTSSRGVGVTPLGLAELEKRGLVPGGRQRSPRAGR